MDGTNFLDKLINVKKLAFCIATLKADTVQVNVCFQNKALVWPRYSWLSELTEILTYWNLDFFSK